MSAAKPIGELTIDDLKDTLFGSGTLRMKIAKMKLG